MSIVRLHVFGVPEAEREGIIYSIPRIKPLALLAYLSIEGGMHPRERLAALLWPGMDEQCGRANLRTTLAIIRRALGVSEGESGVWRTTSDAVGVEPGAVLVDTAAIAAAAALARCRETPPGLGAQLVGALSVYHGLLLDGVNLDVAPDFDAWLHSQRETYHQYVALILRRLAAQQEAEGDLGSAVETLERQVRHDPLDDRAYRRLLAAYLALGDVAAGQRVYDAYRVMHAADGSGNPDREIVALAAHLHQAPTHSVPAFPEQECAPAASLRLPLMGRVGELAALRVRYARASAGTAQIVVVASEAGMGRTRLAAEFVRWAVAEGADVLEGRAFAPAGALPYGALVEALRPRMERENAPDDLLGDRWLAELARLLPELVERYPDLPVLEANRLEGTAHLCEVVARLIQSWGKRRTIVFVLDDVQWTDDATRLLLLYATRHWATSGTRVLLLLTVQTDSSVAASGLASWLRQFASEAATLRLELHALSETATTEMVGLLAGVATPERTEERREARLGVWLHNVSGGMPLLMTAFLYGLLDAGLLGFRVAAAGGWELDLTALEHAPDWPSDALPTGLRDLIVTHVERASPLAQDLLLIGAVLGAEFTLEQICLLADSPEDVVADALDQLTRVHLLREVGGAGQYTVPHEILRTLVYTGAGAARRRMLHRRVLALREAEGAPTVELAHHALAAGLCVQSIASSLAAGEVALASGSGRQTMAQFEQPWMLVDATG